MPLFEIDSVGELVPFRQLRGGAELYEREIENLAWANPEEIMGETLFLIQRQPLIRDGGRPDIVALDRSGRVLVIEVKREFDRGQLAQCLEYAGWARRTTSTNWHRCTVMEPSGSSPTGRSSPSLRVL